MAAPRVDFYVLAGADGAARLRFACRLVEKAYLRSHRVRVQCEPGGEAAAFDELLWTFADHSFVPHARLAADSGPRATDGTPVWIADDAAADPGDADLLVNLAAGVPDGFERYPRIAEIVDADSARRQQGRDRFRCYRDHGLQPATHAMREPS